MTGKTFPAARLSAFVERIERLEEEKAETAEQVKEVYAEAKAYGYDVATLRKVVSRRKKQRDELEVEEALLELYESALVGAVPSDGEEADAE